jgi:hypothetical protein
MATHTQTQMETIAPDKWNEFFRELTQEARGSHATLEIIANDVGDQIETNDRPFEGISGDVKDNERTIWISFGGFPNSAMSDHLTHGIHNVDAVRVVRRTDTARMTVEIESRDHTKTLLLLKHPGEFALPPGEHPSGV